MRQLIQSLLVAIAQAITTPRTEDKKIRQLGETFSNIANEIHDKTVGGEVQVTLLPVFKEVFEVAAAAKVPSVQNVEDVRKILSLPINDIADSGEPEGQSVEQEDTFIDRLKREHQLLHDKLQKLTDFVHGDKFLNLPEIHRNLLLRQKSAMEDYECVLVERVKILTGPQATAGD